MTSDEGRDLGHLRERFVKEFIKVEESSQAGDVGEISRVLTEKIFD